MAELAARFSIDLTGMGEVGQLVACVFGVAVVALVFDRAIRRRV